MQVVAQTAHTLGTKTVQTLQDKYKQMLQMAD